MKDFLTFILSNIADKPEVIDIQEETEDSIIRFNVTLADEDYPKVIGKHGLTIKAITDLLRLQSMRMSPESDNRIYINIRS